MGDIVEENVVQHRLEVSVGKERRKEQRQNVNNGYLGNLQFTGCVEFCEKEVCSFLDYPRLR